MEDVNQQSLAFYVVPGKGNIVINGRDINDYFCDESLRYIVNQPFSVTGTTAQFDVKVNVDGGGIKGQAEVPATLAKSRERNLVSLVHVDASSSVNVNRYLLIFKTVQSVEKFQDQGCGCESALAA